MDKAGVFSVGSVKLQGVDCAGNYSGCAGTGSGDGNGELKVVGVAGAACIGRGQCKGVRSGGSRTNFFNNAGVCSGRKNCKAGGAACVKDPVNRAQTTTIGFKGFFLERTAPGNNNCGTTGT